MASITSIHLPRSRFGGTAANLRSLFPWTEVLKLLKRLTVGQAVPEIPLSVGSKLELLLRACAFAQFPYTSLGPVHSRICPRMHIAMPCIYVYYCISDTCT